jgi:hypothetical protein
MPSSAKVVVVASPRRIAGLMPSAARYDIHDLQDISSGASRSPSSTALIISSVFAKVIGFDIVAVVCPLS